VVEEKKKVKARKVEFGRVADANALHAGEKFKRLRNWIGAHQHHFFPKPSEKVVTAQDRANGITVRSKVERDQDVFGRFDSTQNISGRIHNPYPSITPALDL